MKGMEDAGLPRNGTLTGTCGLSNSGLAST
jgi:hypothetical protein